MSTILLLIRHGITDWNKEGRAQGHIDVPLNSEGVMQAENLAEHLFNQHRDIVAVYSSDLQRAYNTALKTAGKFKLPIVKSANLRENSMGDYDGVLFKETQHIFEDAEKMLDQAHPDFRERWKHTAIPNAETYDAVLIRFKSEIIKIAKKHRGKKVAIFAHGKSIRILMSDCLNRKETSYLDNCEVVVCAFQEDKSLLYTNNFKNREYDKEAP